MQRPLLIADPDQLASSEANWSGSSLFAKAGYIRVQQDKGKVIDTQERPHSQSIAIQPKGIVKRERERERETETERERDRQCVCVCVSVCVCVCVCVLDGNDQKQKTARSWGGWTWFPTGFTTEAKVDWLPSCLELIFGSTQKLFILKKNAIFWNSFPSDLAALINWVSAR